MYNITMCMCNSACVSDGLCMLSRHIYRACWDMTTGRHRCLKFCLSESADLLDSVWHCQATDNSSGKA